MQAVAVRDNETAKQTREKFRKMMIAKCKREGKKHLKRRKRELCWW
jgi:hypothetical protein